MLQGYIVSQRLSDYCNKKNSKCWRKINVKSENMIPMPISGWFTKYIYLMIPSVDQVRR